MLAKIRATIVFVALLVTAPAVADEASSKDFDTLVEKATTHVLRASGAIDAPKGGQLAIKFDLRPVKPKEEPAKQPDPEPLPKAAEPPSQEDKPAPVVVKNNTSALTNSSRTNGSFVFGLGLGFVFEATPTPAMGPHAVIAWRSSAPENWDGSCTSINGVSANVECPPGSGIPCAQSVYSSTLLDPEEACDVVPMPVPNLTSDSPRWRTGMWTTASVPSAHATHRAAVVTASCTCTKTMLAAQTKRSRGKV